MLKTFVSSLSGHASYIETDDGIFVPKHVACCKQSQRLRMNL